MTRRRDDVRIASIQVGRARRRGTEGAADPMDRPWVSGIGKAAVDGPVHLGAVNLAGDEQADLRVHGGPEKAVCCYPAAHLPFWRARLDRPALGAGAFGENFTVEGADETTVCIGDVYAVGGARVQVSQPRSPCWKLARRWRVRDLAVQVQETGFTGWYLRVLHEGPVAAGDGMRLLDRPHPVWTVAEANRVMHRDRDDLTAAAALAELPALAEGWRAAFRRRAAGGTDPDPAGRTLGPNAG